MEKAPEKARRPHEDQGGGHSEACMRQEMPKIAEITRREERSSGTVSPSDSPEEINYANILILGFWPEL